MSLMLAPCHSHDGLDHSCIYPTRSGARRGGAGGQGSPRALAGYIGSDPRKVSLCLMPTIDMFCGTKRYVQLYAESGDKIVKGMKFEETLRAGLARGQYPDAVGREEEWLADRLARHAEPRCAHEQQLLGDRWLRIEERRTADGGSVGIRIDITDLKLREESFRLLFDGNPIPMWVYDRDSLRILAVNNAAVDHYGYSREKFVSMSILHIRPREERETVLAAIAMNEPDKAREDRSWRHLKADGTLIDVSIYPRKPRYEGRDAVLIAAIDINQRKRTENELRDTREFLDMVIENAPPPLL